MQAPTKKPGFFERLKNRKKNRGGTGTNVPDGAVPAGAEMQQGEVRDAVEISEEEFELKLAAGILKQRCSDSDTAQYYSRIGKTPADVCREESFRKFMDSAAAKELLRRYRNGEAVRFSDVSAKYYAFELEQIRTEKEGLIAAKAGKNVGIIVKRGKAKMSEKREAAPHQKDFLKKN